MNSGIFSFADLTNIQQPLHRPAAALSRGRISEWNLIYMFMCATPGYILLLQQHTLPVWVRKESTCVHKSLPAFYLKKNSPHMINASLLEAFWLWTMSPCVHVCKPVWQIWKHFMVSHRGLCDWTSYATPGLKRFYTTARASSSHPSICGMENSTGFTTELASNPTAYSICWLLLTHGSTQ